MEYGSDSRSQEGETWLPDALDGFHWHLLNIGDNQFLAFLEFCPFLNILHYRDLNK